MPDNDSPDFAQRFSDAIVSEIKAEMGRQGMSSRALARAIGANAQFVSSRLDGGNPRTGERVILNVRDLAAIAAALSIREYDLVARAEAVASGWSPTRNAQSAAQTSSKPSARTADRSAHA